MTEAAGAGLQVIGAVVVLLLLFNAAAHYCINAYKRVIIAIWWAGAEVEQEKRKAEEFCKEQDHEGKKVGNSGNLGACAASARSNVTVPLNA